MRRSTSGLLTLLGIGAYYVYRNRADIGRLMNERNINVPFLNRFFNAGGGDIQDLKNVARNVSGSDTTTGYQPELDRASDVRRAV